jgi:hypothetical protein
MIFEMVACKTWIAGNSGTIGKIHNAAGEHFGFIGAVQELIRGSLDSVLNLKQFCSAQANNEWSENRKA